MTSLMLERPIDLGVSIPAPDAEIEADWSVPLHPRGAVIISNGTGNGRLSRRNREVAQTLYDAGYATLLVDLLTLDEDRENSLTGALELDLELLTSRLISAAHWVACSEAAGLPVGFLTSGVASAAAVIAAVREPGLVDAFVSRSGRPDLAGIALHRLVTPTLFITGSADARVFELNRWALRRIRGEGKIAVIPGASHLFEEQGTLKQMTRLALRWFELHMKERVLPFSLPQVFDSWTAREFTVS